MCNKLGFSLIELLAVMLIVSILTTAAISFSNENYANNRAGAIAVALRQSINLAKIEAISHNTRYTICPSNSSSAPTACSTGTSWSNGWILFQDVNADETVASSDKIIKAFGFESNDNVTANSASVISFNGQGIVNGGSLVISISPNNCTGNNARQLSLRASGATILNTLAC